MKFRGRSPMVAQRNFSTAEYPPLLLWSFGRIMPLSPCVIRPAMRDFGGPQIPAAQTLIVFGGGEEKKKLKKKKRTFRTSHTIVWDVRNSKKRKESGGRQRYKTCRRLPVFEIAKISTAWIRAQRLRSSSNSFGIFLFPMNTLFWSILKPRCLSAVRSQSRLDRSFSGISKTTITRWTLGSLW